MVGVRWLVLVLLVAQNSVYTLLRRYYAKGALKETVSASVLLLAGEALKFAVSACLVEASEEEGSTPAAKLGGLPFLQPRVHAITRALRLGFPMIVPAITYAIMNVISYKALEMIDATVFAMVAQLKIVSTALFAWPVLGRKQSLPQWRAILVLTMAVSIITYQRGASRSAQRPDLQLSVTFVGGVLTALVEVSLSGWISTYFEKYLKDGAFSVWGRNLQLSFWSMFIYFALEACRFVWQVVGGDPAEMDSDDAQGGAGASMMGLLSPVAIVLVTLGGGGGLLVAMAIKYADSVIKAMAVSFALVVVVMGEVFLMGASLDPVICLACIIAVLALQTYQDAPKVSAPEPGTKVHGTPQVTGAEARTHTVDPRLSAARIGAQLDGDPEDPEDDREVRPLVFGRS